jgi:regulator of cell morphogenesis and NO signaling
MEMLNTSLAKIAQQLPGATAVFDRYKLSFCCGGKLTLKEAIEQNNLPHKEVLDSLTELLTTQDDNIDWSGASDQDLIEHLLVRYHQVHRQQLAELTRLADRVETVHADNPLCPIGLAEHLSKMTFDLEQHMQKEEQILFPMILRGQGHLAHGPIHVMRLDHKDHDIAVNQIEQLTNGLSIPRGTCNTWRALYQGLKSTINDLRRHILLENDILFTRSLTPSVKAFETGELAHG